MDFDFLFWCCRVMKVIHTMLRFETSGVSSGFETAAGVFLQIFLKKNSVYCFWLSVELSFCYGIARILPVQVIERPGKYQIITKMHGSGHRCQHEITVEILHCKSYFITFAIAKSYEINLWNLVKSCCTMNAKVQYCICRNLQTMQISTNDFTEIVKMCKSLWTLL